MRFTGANDYGKHQAQNFNLELVAALPTFQAEDFGRMVFVATPGPTFGVWVGGITSWQQIASSATPQLLQETEFAYHDLDPRVTGGTDISEMTGITNEIIVPAAGELLMVTASLTPVLTAGGLTVKPTINGVDIPASDLDILFNPGVHYRTRRLSTSDPDFQVNAGDRVGLRAYGNASSLPILTDLVGTIFIKLPITVGANDAYTSAGFAYWTLDAGINEPIYPLHGVYPGIRAADNGYLIATTAQLSVARTAGQVAVRPTINGALVGDPRLNLLLDASNPQNHFAMVSEDPAFSFNAGDVLGLQAISDSSFAPVPLDLGAQLLVLYPL